MTLQEALYELGVRDDTLSQAEKAHLDSEGYVLLPNILSAAQVAAICRAMDAVYAAEGTGQKDGPVESSYIQNKVPGSTSALPIRTFWPPSATSWTAVSSPSAFTAGPIRPAASSRLYTSITTVQRPMRAATPCAIRCGC